MSRRGGVLYKITSGAQVGKYGIAYNHEQGAVAFAGKVLLRLYHDVGFANKVLDVKDNQVTILKRPEMLKQMGFLD